MTTEPTDAEIDAIVQTCRERGLRELDVFRAVLAKWGTPPAEQQATKETSGGFHVWRDISTAPKDGSRFVATGYNYGLYSEGRHACVAQWFRGCWIAVSEWDEISELTHLTHWMPLPPPPTSAEGWSMSKPDNPNNCATCRHKQNPDGEHCYMFRFEPAEMCAQHTSQIHALPNAKLTGIAHERTHDDH